MPLSIGDLGKAIRNARVVKVSNDGFDQQFIGQFA